MFPTPDGCSASSANQHQLEADVDGRGLFFGVGDVAGPGRRGNLSTPASMCVLSRRNLVQFRLPPVHQSVQIAARSLAWGNIDTNMGRSEKPEILLSRARKPRLFEDPLFMLFLVL